MALIPSNIGETLSGWSKGISDVFTNVNDTVQSVNSVYDQLTGQSQSAPVNTSTPQATTTVKPAAVTEVTPQLQTAVPNTTMLAIGAVVLIGVILLLK
jgi:hypothetical protein